MTREKVGVLRHVESYFMDHLQRARGASTHTIRAYGHAIRLFLLFLAQRVRRPVARLELDDIRVEAVLAFLDHLESSRSNTPSTRNCRLAAIHGLVEHLLRSDVTRAGQYERILAVRAKRTRGRVIAYLEAEQVRAILAEPDRRTPAGIRDYALLLLLFNTGARIAEVLALTVEDLRVGGRRQVRVRGKGNKDRICPCGLKPRPRYGPWCDRRTSMTACSSGTRAEASFRATAPPTCSAGTRSRLPPGSRAPAAPRDTTRAPPQLRGRSAPGRCGPHRHPRLPRSCQRCHDEPLHHVEYRDEARRAHCVLEARGPHVERDDADPMATEAGRLGLPLVAVAATLSRTVGAGRALSAASDLLAS